ncbi:MAG: ATP-binding protein [Thermoguttaceae bacterium]|nr:ATP-binding protein [Thermoguttaceae bacterium]
MWEFFPTFFYTPNLFGDFPPNIFWEKVMPISPNFYFTNYDSSTDSSSPEFNFLKSSIVDAAKVYMKHTGAQTLDLNISYGDPTSGPRPKDRSGKGKKDDSDMSMEERQKQFQAQDPDYPDLLVLPVETENRIEDAVNFFTHFEKIFDTWNFKSICPFPCVVLNFHGASGTGKTLAAHVFSRRLGKKIILASYAQITSMYVGEGAKNLEALFAAAESQDAVLFLDEADSLLSKRIQGETSGAEASINAMRGQLLICLEKFKGTVILASNLVKNYDKAFETRIISIEFPMPDQENRTKIWDRHLPKEFPCDSTVSLEKLGEIEDICGRDIRNAVLSVARTMANRQIPEATMEMFEKAIAQIKDSRFDAADKKSEFTKEESQLLGEAFQKQRKLKQEEKTAFDSLKEAIDKLIAARMERKGQTVEDEFEQETEATGSAGENTPASANENTLN